MGVRRISRLSYHHNILSVYNSHLNFLRPMYSFFLFFLFFWHAFVYTSYFSGRSTISNVKRINLKFWVQLQKNSVSSLEMLQQVYGNNIILHAHDFEWHKRFKERRIGVKDNSRNGRPSTSRSKANIKQARQLVCGDCWLIFRMIAS